MNPVTKGRIKAGIGVVALAATAVLICTFNSKKPEPERNCVSPKSEKTMVVCPKEIQVVQQDIICFDQTARKLETRSGTRFKEGKSMGSSGVTPKVETIAPGFYGVELIAPDGTKGWVKTQDCPQNK